MGEKRKIIEDQAEVIRTLREENEVNQELYTQVLHDVLDLVDQNLTLAQEVETLKEQLQNTNIPILSNTKTELTPFAISIANKIDEYMNTFKRKYREYCGDF